MYKYTSYTSNYYNDLIESEAKQMYPKRPGTGISIFPVLCSIKDVETPGLGESYKQRW